MKDGGRDVIAQPLRANFALPLVHEAAGSNDRAMLGMRWPRSTTT